LENSAASSATSDDYEIITPDSTTVSSPVVIGGDDVPPAPPSPPVPRPPELSILVGEGKEQDLQKNIEECLRTTPSPKGEQEEEEDESGHTVFHNILYLGSKEIDDPKSEEDIQSQGRRTIFVKIFH
jgi:hypothetical protein